MPHTCWTEARSQHADIEAALDGVQRARRDWARSVQLPERAALIDALEQLHALVAGHLDAEERTLLPLAAAHLTEAEWGAIGAAGAASVPKPKMPLVFGMFAYEGDPEVIARMLSKAPPVPRLVLPRIAAGVYRRQAAKLYGTTRP